MDYDNDGIQDIITGSYRGEIYLIRGLGDGQYAAVEAIKDMDETPLVHHPVEMRKYLKYVNEAEDPEQAVYDKEASKYSIASFGSWATAMDWENDGDLDVLIGSFRGYVFLRENVGSREKPKYDGDAVAIVADGKLLRENSHANPVAVDWDGDGLTDLVVGAGEGSVSWYRNIGSASQPKFGARKLLVGAPSDSIFLFQFVSEGPAFAPGARAQVCVHDYNGDGQLDLLVGDYTETSSVLEGLNSSRRQELSNVYRQWKANQTKLMGQRTEYIQRYREARDSGAADLEELDEESKQRREKLAAEIEVSWESFDSDARKLIDKVFSESERSSSVWLYLRKPAGQTEEVATSAP